MAEDPTRIPEPGAPRVDLASPVLVIGIGGAADALDSYERVFLGLPPTTDMAFVVVPHLDADHRGLMPSVLARCTSMPVVQVTEDLPLAANCVYVAPPGAHLGMADGTLQLGEPALAGAHVIDGFFTALADDQRNRAVGVVLSGAGSDGTQGVRAIRAQGGRVLVESAHTASDPAMPASAAATGLADDVLPAPDLAARIMGLTALTRMLAEDELIQAGGETGAPLHTILRLIRSRSGHDFTRYKRATLVRRVDRRMKGLGIDDVARYIRVLAASPDEADALFQDFTINVTGFFRDADAFEALKRHFRHYLREHKQPQDTVRVWIAACSTGEEAYSVAMVLRELAGERPEGHSLKIQIFATDIDPVAVTTARQGVYPRDIAYVVSHERLNRFFVLRGDQYQVRAEIRDCVVFATHSTFADPPFTRLDLVGCRNLLIYLTPDLQRQVVELFRYALRPGGLLLLGASESIGADREGFTALDGRWKVYRRGEGTVGLPPLGTASALGAAAPTPGGVAASPALPRSGDPAAVDPGDSGLARHVQDTLLADFTPPAVVVSRQGEVVFVHGHTARYLSVPSGHVQNRIYDMVPEGLRLALRSAVSEAGREQRPVTYRGLVAELQGGPRTLDVAVRPLRRGGEELLVTLHDPGEATAVVDRAGDAGQVLALELELRHGREALRATVGEMGRSLDDLRTSHEELQTTNEELQSTNEELMTSKEELQSLNEELSTVNAEHQVIIQTQARANDDLTNLLETAGTAILFLGDDLTIRRFTPPIRSVVKLTPADLGRPLSDFSITLRRHQLFDDIQRVLSTLEPHESQVQTHDGEWYLMRINPYRTADNRIDGVVVALTGIALVKALEWQLVESLQPGAAPDPRRDPLLLLDQHLRAVTASRALLALLDSGAPPPPGGGGDDDSAQDMPELRRRLRAVIETEPPLSTMPHGSRGAFPDGIQDRGSGRLNRRRDRPQGSRPDAEPADGPREGTDAAEPTDLS